MYQNIVKLMQEHGETPAELSKATGISEALISMWKKRDANGGGISATNAMRIAKHYGVPVDVIIGEV